MAAAKDMTAGSPARLLFGFTVPLREGAMKKSDLLMRLQKGLSQSEWEALAQRNPLTPVNQFNQEVLLELRSTFIVEGEVSTAQVADLCEALQTYLTEYMKEQPEGWKYIILASLYLAFLAGRPMHPIDLLKIDIIETESGPIYKCPQKSGVKGTVCDYCVCERVSDT